MKNRFLLLTTIFFFHFWFTALTAQDASILQNDYFKLKDSINVFKQQMNMRYEQCNSDSEKKEIVKKSSKYIFKILTDKIFPAWYGTSWDFNGVSREPGKGSIACGSFVVFTLQDAGFEIPTRMYQQPSENIIKNLTPSSNIKRFSNNTPMDKIIRWIKSKGEGLFIVGLDIHVGFMIFNNNKITFCHSSYYNPLLQVVNQEITSKSPLTDSKYRVIGKILTSQMIRKWLLGQTFGLKYDYFRE